MARPTKARSARSTHKKKTQPPPKAPRSRNRKDGTEEATHAAQPAEPAPKLKTGEAKACVLELYASGDLTIEQACKRAGYSRAVNQYWLKNDEAYAADFAEAKAARVEVLEDEAYRRAKTGTEKPVFYLGRECGRIAEHSDTLLIFLLKAANPAKYRDNFRQPEAAQGQSAESLLRELAEKHGFTDDPETN